MRPTALLLFAYDSQYKWVRSIGTELEASDVLVRYAVPTDLRHSISPEQVEDHGGAQIDREPWEALVRRAAESDFLVLGLQGPVTSRFLRELDDFLGPERMKAPVIITGWVGIVIEKLVAGYLERFAADIIAVNSGSDLRAIELSASALGLSADNVLLSGLPLLPSSAAPEGSVVPRTVLFADQPTVPQRHAEREYLYRRLVDYALAHPDRRVLLKPRHRLTEDTFHRMEHHPEELIADWLTPPNFEVIHTPISSLLDQIDLLMTVSSTAALEAVGAGVRTAFVSDLGVHERLGNQIALGSGLLRTMDQLIADDLGVVSTLWLDDYFVGTDGRTPAARIVDRALALHGLPALERPSASAVRTAYYLAQRSALGYISTVESRLALERELAHRRVWLPPRGVRGRVLLLAYALLPPRLVLRLRNAL